MNGPAAETIRSMFGSISARYDRANTVLSFGIHHLWRRSLVHWSEARPGSRVLDCATGTGDLAFAFENAVRPGGSVTATDFCDEMLVQARAKAHERSSASRFEPADVLALPYPDSAFDIASIAFGIRNVTDPLRGLLELGRVVRPGGRVMVLEFGQSEVPVWGPLFDFYSRNILPKLGGWVTGKRDAYEYLKDSSAKFPCREEFVRLAHSTGLYDQLEFRPLTGGIAYLYRFRRTVIAA